MLRIFLNKKKRFIKILLIMLFEYMSLITESFYNDQTESFDVLITLTGFLYWMQST